MGLGGVPDVLRGVVVGGAGREVDRFDPLQCLSGSSGVLGVSRTVVFGGLRLRVSGFSARVRPRWGCGSRALSGAACDCRVGFDPRGNKS